MTYDKFKMDGSGYVNSDVIAIAYHMPISSCIVHLVQFLIVN